MIASAIKSMDIQWMVSNTSDLDARCMLGAAVAGFVRTHNRTQTTRLMFAPYPLTTPLPAHPRLQVAQMVDGSLGMGFGVTSSSVLVSAAGLSPLAASAAVHLAQLGTTAVSGIAHARAGNVDVPTFNRLASSGVVGAFVGATLLASLPASHAVPISAGLLFALGAYVLIRFLVESQAPPAQAAPGLGLLLALGACGGFVDATGGGGWGPVATTGLLCHGRLPPHRVVGTISAAEFLVTVAAVAGFLNTLGTDHSGLRLDLVVALLLGGLVAAPLAPMLVKRLPPATLGVSIGGCVVARTRTCSVPDGWW